MIRKTNKPAKRLTAGLLAVFLVFSSLNLDSFADELQTNEEVDSSIVLDVSANEETISDNDFSVEEEISESDGNDADNEVLEEIDEVSDGDETEDSDNIEIHTGYVPSRFDKDTPEREITGENEYYYYTEGGQVAATAIPSSYNTSLAALNKRLPGTRDQNPYGTCWAFGATGTMEASLIAQGYSTPAKTDLSELANAFYAFYSVTDPMGGTAGDTSRSLSAKSDQSWLNSGYNTMGIFYSLSQWLGAPKESAVPYSSAAKVESRGYLGSSSEDNVNYAFSNAEAHLSDMRMINIKTDAENVKVAVMKYGAVAVSYYEDDSYYNRSNNAYYCYTPYGANHAVMIVGWDDNFSASKFSKSPGKNGAWLIRNSWTTSTGMNHFSYFWLSYNDKSLETTAYSLIASPADEYDNIYLYDGGRDSRSSGKSTVANVFTVMGEEASATEELDAVSFLITSSTDVSYKIKIYRGVTSSPNSGTLVSEATTEGSTTYAGYYTVPLSTPVVLNRGEKYAVVISTENGFIDQELGMLWSGLIEAKVSAKSGQSYYYNGSSWETFSLKSTANGLGNYCIKAFTKNLEKIDSGHYRIAFDGNGNTDGIMSAIEALPTDTVILPSNGFVRVGYSFNGWNTKKDGTGTAYADGQSVKGIGKDGTVVKLYAQWIPIQYTVRFDTNGASGSFSDVTAYYNETFVLPKSSEMTHSDSNKCFTGWNTKKDGTGASYGSGEAVSGLSNVPGTITLYAIWKDEFVVIGGVLTEYNGDRTNVIIPDSVKTIPLGFFSKNESIKKVYIPKNVETIANEAFKNCINLEEIVFEEGAKTEIWDMVFLYCYGLKNIVFSDEMTIIGRQAFWYCTNLEQVVLPKKLRNIRENTFAYCNSLSYVTIYGEDTVISSNAFTRPLTIIGVVGSPTETFAYVNGHTFVDIATVYNYSLSFDGNGAESGDVSDISGLNSLLKDTTLPKNKYSRKGYTFAGWCLKADGSGKIYAEGAKLPCPATYDGQKVKVYAIWKANTYKLSYNVNGGKALSTTSKTITYDSTYGTLPKPTRSGYTFWGWYTEKAGGTKITEDTVVSVTSAQTIYAHWYNGQYTVTLDPGTDGTCGISEIYVYGGNKYGYRDTVEGNNIYKELPEATCTRPGYYFSGWYTAPEGGSIVTADTMVSAKADHTLYAHYEIIKYDVTLNLQGGSFNGVRGEKEAVDWHTVMEVPLNPIRSCYEFTGWTMDEEGTTPYDFTSIVTEDFTLYAQWTAIYKVSEVYADIDHSEVEEGTRLTLSTDTNGARIYYTLDGSMPTGESILYTDALVLSKEISGTEDIYVYAYAVKDDYENSDVSTYAFRIIDHSFEWGDVTEEDRAFEGLFSPDEIPAGLWIAGVPASVPYTGSAITFKGVHVYNHKTLLKEKTSYTIAYSKNKAAGDATITVSGKGNYSGTFSKEFTIEQHDITWADVKITVPDVKYVKEKNNYVSAIQLVGLQGVVLTKNTDYKVLTTYVNDTVVKNGTKTSTRLAGSEAKSGDIVPNGTDMQVVITGNGSYTGSVTKYYTVSDSVRVDGNLSSATVTIPKQKYTGSEITLTGTEGTPVGSQIKVVLNGKTLVMGQDYEILTYKSNTNAGTAYVTFSGIYDPAQSKYYTGTKTVKFTIEKQSLADAEKVAFVNGMGTPWNSSVETIMFSKSGNKPDFSVLFNGTPLVPNVDYTYTITNNKAVKSYNAAKNAPVITIKGKGNFAGTISGKFSITARSIGSVTAMGEVYKGSSYKLPVKVVDDEGYVLGKDDYKIYYTYADDTAITGAPDVGEMLKARVVGTGNYVSEVYLFYTVGLREDIGVFDFYSDEGALWNEETVTAEFSKSGAKHDVIVYAGYTRLEEGVDYVLSYTNNKSRAAYNSSKAPSITVKGIGQYCGTKILKFSVVSKDISSFTISAPDKTYSKSANKYKSTPTILDENGKKLVKGDYKNIKYYYGADVTLANGIVRKQGVEISSKDILPVGTLIRISVEGSGNYCGSATSSTPIQTPYTYKIAAGSIASAKVSVAEQNYTGTKITPDKSEMTVKIGSTVLGPQDYEIAGYSNNVNKGTAKITIRGIGNYTGTKTATFKIVQKTMYFTVIFNGNGATSGSMKKMLIASGKVAKLSAFNYMKKYYVSNSESGVWNTKPDGSGYSFGNKDDCYNIGHDGETIVLYAQWVEIPKVSFIYTMRANAAKNATSERIVSWSAVQGVNGYAVYYATSENGTYKKGATVIGTSATVKNLSADKVYYFKVVAIGKDSVNNKAVDVFGPMSDVTATGKTFAKPSVSGSISLSKSGSFRDDYGIDHFAFATKMNLKNNGKYDLVFDSNKPGEFEGEYAYGFHLDEMSGLVYLDEDVTIEPGKTVVSKWDTLGSGLSGWSWRVWSGGFFGNFLKGQTSVYANYEGVTYKITVSTSGKITIEGINYEGE